VNPAHGLRDGHEILRFFDAFALTRYEKLAYLNLLINGAQTYKGLVRNTSIPYGKVYVVMHALERKGFITITSDRPMVFRPVDPQDVFDRHYVTLRNALDDYLERSRAVLTVLRPLYHQTRVTPRPCRTADDIQCVLVHTP
jgi:sugar-specific transcriptional regulator TrmB